MFKPNFFILGAPKCGTTSMAKWLSEHPEIFMSKYKEPHYYNTDNRRVVVNHQHYLSLFKKIKQTHATKILNGRIRIPNYSKAFIVVRAGVVNRLNLI